MQSVIAAASEEQSATSEQIARSVDRISLVTQESAQGVGLVSQSADGLNPLTEDLRNLIGRFNIGDVVAGDAVAGGAVAGENGAGTVSAHKSPASAAPKHVQGDGSTKGLPQLAGWGS